MEFEFEGAVLEWRGPAPFYFVAIPQEESDDIKRVAKGIEYWGQVPVTVRIGDTQFSTALFPKDGRYLLPLKDAVRKAAGIAVDQIVAVELSVGRQERRTGRQAALKRGGGSTGRRRGGTEPDTGPGHPDDARSNGRSGRNPM